MSEMREKSSGSHPHQALGAVHPFGDVGLDRMGGLRIDDVGVVGLFQVTVGVALFKGDYDSGPSGRPP